MDEMDEVDGIVAGWTAVRPELDLAALQVLSRVRRLSHLLDNRREQAFAEYGLAAHEFDVLAALRRSGEAAELTPGQLVEATHVTSGTMTNRLDRLEGRRLISRRAHPTDGRVQLVRLSAAGRRRVDGALDALLAFEDEMMAEVGGRDQATMIRALRVLLAGEDVSG
ncbi:MAG TPA: MarR family transcriptional regulator [Jatrophihabitans sp.]|jgi:DNA-binding MarR family transcriptional regulator